MLVSNSRGASTQHFDSAQSILDWFKQLPFVFPCLLAYQAVVLHVPEVHIGWQPSAGGHHTTLSSTEIIVGTSEHSCYFNRRILHVLHSSRCFR